MNSDVKENSVNNLVIKQKTDNTKLHRWKTWEPNTPFAPVLDVSLYLDRYEEELCFDLKKLIELAGVGKYSEASNLANASFFDEWTKYNIFEWTDPCILKLKDKIWNTYLEYCSSIDVPSFPREEILIRGWAVRLDPGEPIGMHSHSLHENTFVSGNMSLETYPTSTDYWIPLFSLYHGPFECPNVCGNICMFPSWVQHGVAHNEAGRVRYTVAFDMFIKKSIDYIVETDTASTDLAKIILLSVPL